jgi:hypothetical protein
MKNEPSISTGKFLKKEVIAGTLVGVREPAHKTGCIKIERR